MGRTYNTTGVSFDFKNNTSVTLDGGTANSSEIAFTNNTDSSQPVRMYLSQDANPEFYFVGGTAGTASTANLFIGDGPNAWARIDVISKKVAMQGGTSSQIGINIETTGLITFTNNSGGGTLATLDSNGNLLLAGTIGENKSF